MPWALVGTGVLFPDDLIAKPSTAQASRLPSARERLLAIQRSSVRVKGRQSPRGSPRASLQNRDLQDVVEATQTVSDVKAISLI